MHASDLLWACRPKRTAHRPIFSGVSRQFSLSSFFPIQALPGEKQQKRASMGTEKIAPYIHNDILNRRESLFLFTEFYLGHSNLFQLFTLLTIEDL